MSVIAIVLVVIIAFFAGMEGILDEFQIHQPLVSATLIGLVTGHLTAGIILGGTLQMIALGWANIGAAVAPDVALASVASSIIMVKGGDFSSTGISVAVASAIPLAVAGLFLTMLVRTVAVGLTHGADAAAKEGKLVLLNACIYLHLYYRSTYSCTCCYFNCCTCCGSESSFDIYARMVNWWHGYRWWYGCRRWLCHGY